jgi:hypothetical protein
MLVRKAPAGPAFITLPQGHMLVKLPQGLRLYRSHRDCACNAPARACARRACACNAPAGSACSGGQDVCKLVVRPSYDQKTTRRVSTSIVEVFCR